MPNAPPTPGPHGPLETVALAAIDAARTSGGRMTGAMFIRLRTAHEIRLTHQRALDFAKRLAELTAAMVRDIERDDTAGFGSQVEGQLLELRRTLHELRVLKDTHDMAACAAELEAGAK